MKSVLRLVGLIAALLAVTTANAKDKRDFASPEEAKDRADFQLQGEYVGDIDGDRMGLHVIAQLNKKDKPYAGIAFPGGLPGDGWIKSDRIVGSGSVNDKGVLVMRADEDGHGYLEIADGEAKAYGPDGEYAGTLKKIDRKSKTLGKKPPKNAIVLFDGKSADKFTPGKMTKDGLLIPRADTKQKLGSGTLHIEFRTPYSPYANGQGRGNSGVYLQSRYEVQVLDSFGVLKPGMGDCGSIYSIRATPMNMSYPPLTWQTYDIEFTASTKGADGKLVDGRATVRHNGVLIHENVQLTKSTTASPIRNKNAEDAPLHLQWHGNPVRFRNIWFVPKK